MELLAGYSEFLKHNDKAKNKMVSPREYFAFHLNMCNLDADFLFKFGRPFQEFIYYNRKSEIEVSEEQPSCTQGGYIQEC